jgi:micrococcal nuclease
MKMILIAAVGLLVGSAGTAGVMTMTAASPITGHARIIDGDTLIVDHVKIRLNGVDAPEIGKPNSRDYYVGLGAKFKLTDIVGGAPIACQPDGTRSYDRIVAVCKRVSDGLDIGAELIRRGWALDCPRFSKGRYAHLEPQGVRVRRLHQAPYC